MTRDELVLAALAPASGELHTPVQVQKLFFLIDQNVAHLIGGPFFDFEPYHYGPFDKSVYDELSHLAMRGLVDVTRSRWNSYRLTVQGQERGAAILESLDPKAANYIRTASKFVRDLSFTQLVAAIYRAYPAMRERSVFQG